MNRYIITGPIFDWVGILTEKFRRLPNKYKWLKIGGSHAISGIQFREQVINLSRKKHVLQLTLH